MLEIFTLLNPVIAPDERTTLIESASPVAEFVYVVTGTDVLTCVPDPPQPANTVKENPYYLISDSQAYNRIK